MCVREKDLKLGVGVTDEIGSSAPIDGRAGFGVQLTYGREEEVFSLNEGKSSHEMPDDVLFFQIGGERQCHILGETFC